MIKLDRISKSYVRQNGKLKIPVLNSISCTIEKGEMVAIKGRSGSGKTTIINILAGLLKADSGTYYFNAKEISKLNLKQTDKFREKNVGIIVQDYALLNSLSAKENILLPVKYRKYDKKDVEEDIKILSSQLKIEHCLNKNIYELSGGEAQRVAIARALIKKPNVILADEPTGSLDIRSEQEVLKILLELKQLGNTIIISTHSKAVSDCCDRILEINDGTFNNSKDN